MQLVWGMMNTLQLITYSLKFSLIVPDNVYTFFEVINEFLSMRAQFIQKWMDWVMDQIGMSSSGEGETNVLKNMETLLIALVGIVMLILLALLLKIFINKFEV